MCCDGTWAVARPRHGTPTNVAKIARMVAPAGRDGTAQRVCYLPGVGTGPFDRLRGGLFGAGLSAQVLAGYRFLIEEYSPGDEILLFGFSRGAYTARSLAGLIRNSGLLRRERIGLVDDAYRLYRARDRERDPDAMAAELFRRSHSYEPEIRCVGVFDTVGALGVPVGPGGLGSVLNRRWEFHDTRLGPAVRAAFHALAMDERRGPFVPTLWTGPFVAGQRVEQVWFRGGHSDVGGGLHDPALAECALTWMAERAEKCGLAFEDGAFGSCPARPAPGDRDRDRGACVVADPLADRGDTSDWLARPPLGPHERSFGTARNGSESISDAALARARGRPGDPPPAGFRTGYASGSGAVVPPSPIGP